MAFGADLWAARSFQEPPEGGIVSDQVFSVDVDADEGTGARDAPRAAPLNSQGICGLTVPHSYLQSTARVKWFVFVPHGVLWDLEMEL